MSIIEDRRNLAIEARSKRCVISEINCYDRYTPDEFDKHTAAGHCFWPIEFFSLEVPEVFLSKLKRILEKEKEELSAYTGDNLLYIENMNKQIAHYSAEIVRYVKRLQAEGLLDIKESGVVIDAEFSEVGKKD
jgi:hypothetical protein